jgi:hypothetical protein
MRVIVQHLLVISGRAESEKAFLDYESFKKAMYKLVSIYLSIIYSR